MKTKKIIFIISVILASLLLAAVICFLTGARGRTALSRILREDPELKRTKSEILWPTRGEIFDSKGRVIATNKTVWDVHLDCTVLQAPEDEWKALAYDLATELEAILGEKTAAHYYGKLIDGRRENKQYLAICEDVEDSLASALMHAPLLNMGQFQGGAIFTPKEVRKYTYGRLGRRVIGYSYNNHAIGIEGAYDSVLRGEIGKMVYARKCKKGRYYWKEKSRKDAADGQDVKTVLNMDQMAIVDAELRFAIEGRKDIQSACAVLMEAKTGAVRAMTNLSSGHEGDTYDEVYNLAIGYEYEPGCILTNLPAEVLENGLDSAKFDLEGLRDTHYAVEDKGTVNVACSPLHVLRIFGGIANDGEMFDPYLVMPSSSRTLCSAAMADSLKAVLAGGIQSTAIVPHSSINGSDPYVYPSGDREFATTWAGCFNADGTEYVLMVAAFSKKTKADAPQRDVPGRAARGIMGEIL